MECKLCPGLLLFIPEFEGALGGGAFRRRLVVTFCNVFCRGGEGSRGQLNLSTAFHSYKRVVYKWHKENDLFAAEGWSRRVNVCALPLYWIKFHRITNHSAVCSKCWAEDRRWRPNVWNKASCFVFLIFLCVRVCVCAPTSVVTHCTLSLSPVFILRRLCVKNVYFYFCVQFELCSLSVLSFL